MSGIEAQLMRHVKHLIKEISCALMYFTACFVLMLTEAYRF